MGKGLRLDPNSPADKEFLEKRIGKESLRHLLSPSKRQTIITSASNDLNLTEITESSQIDSLIEKKRPKYGGIKVLCKTLNKLVKSTGEHDYYHILLNFQKAGYISDLKHEERTKLIVNDKLICTFLIDYQFMWQGAIRHCDYKSIATSPPGFIVKKKLFEALFGQPVYIIRKDKRSIVDEILDFVKSK